MMNAQLFASLFFMSGMAQAGPAQAPAPVAPAGPTVIEASGETMSARVTIQAHERQITTSSGEKPASDHSSCTYSRAPCSEVEFVDIEVDGRSLWIPRIVYADLADVNTAEVRIDGKKGRLILDAGDASAAYVVEIEFDENRVTRMTVASALMPGELQQETVFHETPAID
jgi:hypothetical protein